MVGPRRMLGPGPDGPDSSGVRRGFGREPAICRRKLRERPRPAGRDRRVGQRRRQHPPCRASSRAQGKARARASLPATTAGGSPDRPFDPSTARSDDSIRSCASVISGRAGAFFRRAQSGQQGSASESRYRRRSTRRGAPAAGHGRRALRDWRPSGRSSVAMSRDGEALPRPALDDEGREDERRTPVGLRPELDEHDRRPDGVGGPHERVLGLARVPCDHPNDHLGAHDAGRVSRRRRRRAPRPYRARARAARRASR